MSALRTAAQQALEALENCTSEHGHRCNRCDSEVDEGGRVVAALRAALAQQEQMQEPVEIKPPNPEGATLCIVRWLAETPAGWVGAWDREALERLERFTAHPPRREWVNLTEEEIQTIVNKVATGTYQTSDTFARAIEQALKERNA